MAILRYSAIEMFGIPIEITPANGDVDALFLQKLMKNYGIEAQAAPEDLTDVTPYYWEKNAFRYMLSTSPTGDGLLELLPTSKESTTSDGVMTDHDFVARQCDVRTIPISETEHMAAITGGSPRFAGKLCLHELFVYKQDE